MRPASPLRRRITKTRRIRQVPDCSLDFPSHYSSCTNNPASSNPARSSCWEFFQDNRTFHANQLSSCNRCPHNIPRHEAEPSLTVTSYLSARENKRPKETLDSHRNFLLSIGTLSSSSRQPATQRSQTNRKPPWPVSNSTSCVSDRIPVVGMAR